MRRFSISVLAWLTLAVSAWAQVYSAGDVIDVKFTTRTTAGVPSTLGGTPAIKVYKTNSTSTEVTTGVTLSADFDSTTGLNSLRIDTSSDGTFYSNGSSFAAVITAGTVNSVSVVGETVLNFRLEAAPLKPATAGRTLLVDSSGAASAQSENLPRVWYVTKAGNDSNAGTKASPKLTVNAAVTAASSGDKIVIGAGTYTEEVTITSKPGLTLEGVGWTTIISFAEPEFGGALTLDDHCTCRNMKLTSSAGYGAWCEKRNCTFEDVWMFGDFEGLHTGSATQGLRLKRCLIEGNGASANIVGGAGILIEDCRFVCGATYASASEHYSGLQISLGAVVTIKNSRIAITKAAANALNLYGIQLYSNDGTGATLRLENVDIEVTASHASHTGAVLGIATFNNNAPFFVSMEGGAIATSHANGSGVNKHIEISANASSVAKVRGTRLDTTKLYGAVQVLDKDTADILVDTGTTLDGRIPAALVSGRMDISVGAYQSGLAPLQPTTAGRTLDVTATGAAGIDWANVENPTTTLGLSGTTVKDATDVGSAPTASENAAAVADELLANHSTVGSLGLALNFVYDQIADAMTPEELAAALNAAGGASIGQVDNKKTAPQRVIRITDRQDGTYTAESPVRLTAGERMTWWVDMSPIIGESWIDDVGDATTDDVGELTVTSAMNRELLVLHFDGTNAVAGETYEATCEVVVGDDLLTVVVEVRIKE